MKKKRDYGIVSITKCEFEKRLLCVSQFTRFFFVCVGPVCYSRDLQVLFLAMFFLIGSHGTIHTCNKYFATAFFVFSNK